MILPRFMALSQGESLQPFQEECSTYCGLNQRLKFQHLPKMFNSPYEAVLCILQIECPNLYKPLKKGVVP